MDAGMAVQHDAVEPGQLHMAGRGSAAAPRKHADARRSGFSRELLRLAPDAETSRLAPAGSRKARG